MDYDEANGFDPDDIVLMYCEDCDEEYQVIAGVTECPICNKELEECL